MVLDCTDAKQLSGDKEKPQISVVLSPNWKFQLNHRAEPRRDININQRLCCHCIVLASAADGFAAVVVVATAFPLIVLLISFRFYTRLLSPMFRCALTPIFARTPCTSHTPFSSHFTLKVFFKRKSEQKRRNDLFLFERVDFARCTRSRSALCDYYYYSWIRRKCVCVHLMLAPRAHRELQRMEIKIYYNRSCIERNTHERTLAHSRTTRDNTIEMEKEIKYRKMIV